MAISDLLTGRTQREDSTADQQRLAELCGIVDLGIRQFHKVGLALEEIRDRSLYKITHPSFAAFLQARWHMSEAHATRLIQAADLCRSIGQQARLIENENQARQLRSLDPDTRNQALATAAANNEPLRQVLKRHLPIGKKQPRQLRPIRLRGPGYKITIEPNKRFPGLEAALTAELAKLRNANAA